MMKTLAGWVTLLVVANMVWLYLDQTPPAWDQAAHIRGVVLVNKWLGGGGSLIDLIRSFGGYPPLIYFLGGVWSLVAGVGVTRITLINTFFLVAGVVGVYKLTGNKVLPAVVFSLFPVVYDISRNMLLDLPLTVWVVWGLYFWMTGKDVGVLVMVVLASLTKLNGFIYFLPIVISYWHKPWRLLMGGLIYLLAVGWWWGVNWNNIYQYLTGLAGQGEVLTDPMNLWEWRTWLHYGRLFFLHQLGPVTTILFLIFSKKENKKLIWWVVAVYVMFTVIRNKDFRFTMPLLPVIAVWFGWGLEQRVAGRVGQVLVGLVLVWMGFNYVENSFNWPIKKPLIVSTPTFVFGDVEWVGWDNYPVREYRSQVWPQERIIRDLPDGKLKLLMLMNVAELNDNNLGLYRWAEGKNNIEIHGVDKWGKMDFDYVVTPDLETESAPFYDTWLKLRKNAVREIWGGEYEMASEYELPSGGKVYLFRVLKSTQIGV